MFTSSFGANISNIQMQRYEESESMTLDDVLSDQQLDFEALTRQKESIPLLIQQSKPSQVLASRESYIQHTWLTCQARNAHLHRLATGDEKKATRYFVERRFALKEAEIFELLDKITTYRAGLDQPPQHQPPDPPTETAQQSGHLSSLKVPKFSGKPIEWQSFRDLFTSLVDTHACNNVTKLWHLRSSVADGDAHSLISNLAVTHDNFQVAWDLLTSEYENKVALVNAHLNAIFLLEPIKKESPEQLRLLRVTLRKHLGALKQLGRPTDGYSDILINRIGALLDSQTKRDWGLSLGAKPEFPTYDEFDQFLLDRVQVLESLDTPAITDSGPSGSKMSDKPHSRSVKSHVTSSNDIHCILCDQNHRLFKCPKFKAMSIPDRFEYVKSQKLCINCFNPNHKTTECKSTTCTKCKSKHNTLLHRDSEQSQEHANATPHSSTPGVGMQLKASSTVLHLACPNRIPHYQIRLATARVWVLSPTNHNRAVRVRALLDQGSTWSFMSQDLARVLQVKRERIHETLSGVGGSNAGSVSSSANIRIAPTSQGDKSFSTTVLILPTITSYRSPTQIDMTSFSHLASLDLADDLQNDDPIHLLIGANLYGALVLEGLRKGQPNEPIAQNTVFGWVISGYTPVSKSTPNVHTHHTITNAMLNASLQNFWTIEELPQPKILSVEDELCEAHFSQTHSRTSDGRYVVRIPFKPSIPFVIGKSRHIAESLLLKLEKRLSKNELHRSMYVDFMKDYEQSRHMQRVPSPSNSERSPIEPVYLPHHAVFRENSQTTKLRVVFNASAKTSNHSSINDFMFKGPALQSDLPTIITNWRSYKHVYTADLAQMYRNILVNPLDVDHQRILWRTSPSESIEDYQLLTVTYGTRSAPFLALRVIKQLVEDEGDAHPIGAHILSHDIFVDDLLFGAHTVQEAVSAREDLVSLLIKGQFVARKWTGNSPALLEGIDPANHGLAWTAPVGEGQGLKILGVHWSPTDDLFRFNTFIEPPNIVTKRIALSLIAKLFDPVGWISPVVITGKLFFQQLCRDQFSWDDHLPESLSQPIITYFHSLKDLAAISIPRWTGLSPQLHKAQIHGFADASEKAYGAAIYLRVEHSDGIITSMLLSSKSKVAPLKPVSIPRLELQAALLLARSMTAILKVRTLSTIPYQCWSDASIVLTWLARHPSNWKTFVAHRVCEIQSLLPNHVWRHVPTTTNPGDLVSRGVPVHELIDSTLWWNGPPWLIHSESDWPNTLPHVDPTTNLEEKSTNTSVHLNAVQFDQLTALYERCSTWHKLIRSLAYVFKFIEVLRSKGTNSSGISKLLNSTDLQKAELTIVKHLQSSQFPSELKQLKTQAPLSGKSKLISLNPCLNEGIIRVGGRLDQSDMSFSAKHPIILSNHRVITLLINDIHARCLHGGVKLTLSTLRQTYWVINARSLVKFIVYKCLDCAKIRASLAHQIMGNLPKPRVTRPPRTFTDTGLDYAGPLQVRTNSGRGHKAHPCYIALFVCFAVKAIHLELVTNYSTEAFLAAFKRFTSRRGLPERLHSDCGTNFRGADRELSEAFSKACTNPEFQSLLSKDRIQWNFIPPAAPHFGGLWEAGVRSVKGHLKRILGDKTPTYEELMTILCQIEAVLNSRPLGPLSDDVDSWDVLTPGHFMAGGSLIAVPQPSLVHLSQNRLSRWELMQQCSEIFWNRWSTDYLQSLQQRTKWRIESKNAKTGQLVLLKQPNLPPTKWLLGRLEECIPGRDGNIRTVKVKTQNSTYLRPITAIAFLPVDLDDDGSDQECSRQSVTS